MVIADFEGGGISDTEEDATFQRDLPSLIRKYVRAERLPPSQNLSRASGLGRLRQSGCKTARLFA